VAGNGRPGDAVLVNAVIGAKRLGDFVDKAILEGHEALALGGYFARGGARGVVCVVGHAVRQPSGVHPPRNHPAEHGRYASHVWA
jgi:ATP sulfurylase